MMTTVWELQKLFKGGKPYVTHLSIWTTILESSQFRHCFLPTSFFWGGRGEIGDPPNSVPIQAIWHSYTLKIDFPHVK